MICSFRVPGVGRGGPSNGKVVDQGDSQALFSAPKTDYARTLLDAVLHLGGPSTGAPGARSAALP